MTPKIAASTTIPSTIQRTGTRAILSFGAPTWPSATEPSRSPTDRTGWRRPPGHGRGSRSTSPAWQTSHFGEGRDRRRVPPASRLKGEHGIRGHQEPDHALVEERVGEGGIRATPLERPVELLELDREIVEADRIRRRRTDAFLSDRE